MAVVQLLFDFALEHLGFGPRRPRRASKEASKEASKRPPKRTRPPRPRTHAVVQVQHLSSDAPRMPRPPRGIDHEKPSQRRYDAVVTQMLAAHGLAVRRWRNSLSGVAIERTFRDGRVERTIESPYPTSPLRLAIFLHEVGHHVLGLGVHKPRCLEEFLAWRFAIDRMDEMGFPTAGAVARRFERSMRYAVAKSTRRGIRALPSEVARFAA
ncbi:MAG: hypothetical protein GC172_00825 [Phycisphaera sp.]|nr:hypothetical protein [Phycisphaera sp.]